MEERKKVLPERHTYGEFIRKKNNIVIFGNTIINFCLSAINHMIMGFCVHCQKLMIQYSNSFQSHSNSIPISGFSTNY